MEKVYQITMYECDGYDYSQCTLGIFTDKEVAEGIVSKFNTDIENELNKLYAKQDEFDKDEDIDYEIRNLQRISYDIKEIIINQLVN
jgi:hypothetical protein